MVVGLSGRVYCVDDMWQDPACPLQPGRFGFGPPFTSKHLALRESIQSTDSGVSISLSIPPNVMMGFIPRTLTIRPAVTSNKWLRRLAIEATKPLITVAALLGSCYSANGYTIPTWTRSVTSASGSSTTQASASASSLAPVTSPSVSWPPAAPSVKSTLQPQHAGQIRYSRWRAGRGFCWRWVGHTCSLAGETPTKRHQGPLTLGVVDGAEGAAGL